MEEREGEVRWDGLCSRDAAARDAALDTIGQAVLRRAESVASGAAADGLPVSAARDGLGEALARLLMLSKRCPFPDVREKSAAILSGVQGGKEYLMRAHFGLPSVEAEDKEGKPPISVKFEIPYFTTSGIQVRYLKIIEKSGYQALPWVRYITQNGDYQLRTQ